MATELILTSDKFVQITTGSNNAYLSVPNTPGNGVLCWTDSATEPAIDAVVHEGPGRIGWNSSLVIWARAKSVDCRVSVTYWE